MASNDIEVVNCVLVLSVQTKYIVTNICRQVMTLAANLFVV